MYIDEKSNRIASSSRFEKFLRKTPADYEPGEQVDLLIVSESQMGYSAIIDNAHLGLLHRGDVFKPLRIGQKITGFVKKVRTDQKIDLVLQQPGYDKISAVAEHILEILRKRGGFIDVTDKSPPERISELFGVSKKTYKMAVGSLYKRKLIHIDEQGISLVSS